MQQEFNIQWHRIIFCGSVVSDRFPFEQLLSRFTPPILNEIGTKDFWPALAEAVTWGYGSVGSHGFMGAPVIERWHRGLAHSDFFTSEFCEKFWIPFLHRGTVVPADKPEPLPSWIRFITRLPLKWLIAISFAGLLAIFLSFAWDKIAYSHQSWAVSSVWMGSGNNQRQVCNGLKGEWEEKHPGHTVEIKSMSENNRKDIFGKVEYQYHCVGIDSVSIFALRWPRLFH
jgi:hypothetical protein